MKISDLMPLIIAAAIVVVIICLKVATMRLNAKRKKEGRETIPEPESIDVIDWTKR